MGRDGEGFEYDDDHRFDYMDDAFDDCDCSDEEIDIIEGTAKCWRCGDRRHLDKLEWEQAMNDEAEFQELLSAEMER